MADIFRDTREMGDGVPKLRMRQGTGISGMITDATKWFLETPIYLLAIEGGVIYWLVERYGACFVLSVPTIAYLYRNPMIEVD